uniref:formate--tetrahydrofolate ligase n=1 Tax=Treponema primitia TaxID=88058 RepID=UPI00025553EB
MAKGSDAVKKFIGSDIDIAQAVYPEHAYDVNEIAAKLSIPEKYIEQYGKYKAKIDYNYLNNELKDKKDGKLILVTAITPTPAGEG